MRSRKMANRTSESKMYLINTATKKPSLVTYIKLLGSIVFLLKIVVALLSLGNSVFDICSDIVLAGAYYKGLDRTTPCNDSRKYTKLTRERNYKGPKEKYWFFLSIGFVLAPPSIRLLSISTPHLMKSYFFFHKDHFIIRHIKRQRGCLGLFTCWTLKALLFPFFPAFILVKQLQKIPLMFRIRLREVCLLPPLSYKDYVKQHWKIVKATLQSWWLLFKGVTPTEGDYSKDSHEVQYVVSDILTMPEYKESELCRRYNKLSQLGHDRFFETFVESGPQTILQIMIFFELCNKLEVIRGLTILSSFASLTFAVVGFEMSQIKKNPAKREPTLLGTLLIFCGKVPAIAARCIGLGMFFTSTAMKGKVVGFVIIAFITLAFAGFEYSCMFKEEKYIPPKVLTLILRLLTRGYIANFTLLNYRTKYYDPKIRAWIDGSDEKKSNDSPKQFVHQFWYYIIMTLVNIILVYPFYIIERPSGYFGKFNYRGIFVGVVVTGAPLSILFLAAYEYFKSTNLVTERTLFRAMDGLQFHLKQLVENDKCLEFQKLLERLNDRDKENILGLKDEKDNDIFDYILHHHNPNTHICLNAYVKQFCLDDKKRERLLKMQAARVLCEIRYGDNEIENILKGSSAYCKEVLQFCVDKRHQSAINALFLATYLVQIEALITQDVQSIVSELLSQLTAENNTDALIEAYHRLDSIKHKLSKDISKTVMQDPYNGILNKTPVTPEIRVLVTAIAINLGLHVSQDRLLNISTCLVVIMQNNLLTIIDIAKAQFNKRQLSNAFDEKLFLKPCTDLIWCSTAGVTMETKSKMMIWMLEIGYSELNHVSDFLCELVKNNQVGIIRELTPHAASWKEKFITSNTSRRSNKSVLYEASQIARESDVPEEAKIALSALLNANDIIPVKYIPLKPRHPEDILVGDETWPVAYAHVSFVHNGLIHLWTGAQKYESEFLPSDYIWTYSPLSNKFSKRKISGDIPKKRQFAAIGVIGGKALLFGGTCGKEQHLNDLHELDLENLNCKLLHPPNKPSPRRNMSFWVWKSNFYIWRGWAQDFANPEYISDYGVVEGDEASGRTDQLIVYGNGDWRAVQTKGNNPSTGNCSISPISSDGKVYTIGGNSVDSPKTLYILNMATMEWSALHTFSDMPRINYIRDAVILNTSLLILPIGHKLRDCYKIDMNRKVYRKVLKHPHFYQRAAENGMTEGNGMTDGTVIYLDDLERIFVFGGMDDISFSITPYSHNNMMSRYIIEMDVSHLI